MVQFNGADMPSRGKTGGACPGSGEVGRDVSKKTIIIPDSYNPLKPRAAVFEARLLLRVFLT